MANSAENAENANEAPKYNLEAMASLPRPKYGGGSLDKQPGVSGGSDVSFVMRDTRGNMAWMLPEGAGEAIRSGATPDCLEDVIPSYSAHAFDGQEPYSIPIEERLPPEEELIFMGRLRERYEQNVHNIPCHREVLWSEVEAKLKANPAKLAALKRMDETGGEPDMTGVEMSEGEQIFLFDELAAKLPDSRRDVTYAQALAGVRVMGSGVKLMHPERYKELGNEMKIMMDTRNDWVWLDTSGRQDVLDAGDALCGDRLGGRVRVSQYYAYFRNHDGAFRCSLRV